MSMLVDLPRSQTETSPVSDLTTAFSKVLESFLIKHADSDELKHNIYASFHYKPVWQLRNPQTMIQIDWGEQSCLTSTRMYEEIAECAVNHQRDTVLAIGASLASEFGRDVEAIDASDYAGVLMLWTGILSHPSTKHPKDGDYTELWHQNITHIASKLALEATAQSELASQNASTGVQAMLIHVPDLTLHAEVLYKQRFVIAPFPKS